MSSERHDARHQPAGTYRLGNPTAPTPRNGEAGATGALEAGGRWVPPASGDDQPHPQLVAEVGQLPLGTVLVVGGGGDVIWLASHGWQVTAVGLSAAAATRAPVAAGAAGVGHRIRWLSAGLSEGAPPAATFDLVCACNVQLPAGPPVPVHRRLAAGVRPGGFLLLIGQHPDAAASVPTRGPRCRSCCSPPSRPPRTSTRSVAGRARRHPSLPAKNARSATACNGRGIVSVVAILG